MGFAIAPDVTGSPWRRAANAAALADASFVMARGVDGGFDPRALVWAAPVQYVSWVGGTVVGAIAAGAIADPTRWGLDVLFPCSTSACCCPSSPETAELGGGCVGCGHHPRHHPGSARWGPDRPRRRGRSDRSPAVIWILIAVLCLGSLTLKAFGPLLAGGRTPPAALRRVITLLTPALIASLVVTGTRATECAREPCRRRDVHRWIGWPTRSR